ncbi:hypothetical protein BJ322DRAFT_1087958 [Thelephora terrestris]|uniref:Uncharacterized protein n=1 Tax=Thelephora terrestris TaxID=56493 RepID=A0A9P6H7W9_9AGAM|nr:hypothetical protein BJ322DRAFT_1087958 [Thelephora terrestris]
MISSSALRKFAGHRPQLKVSGRLWAGRFALLSGGGCLSSSEDDCPSSSEDKSSSSSDDRCPSSSDSSAKGPCGIGSSQCCSSLLLSAVFAYVQRSFLIALRRRFTLCTSLKCLHIILLFITTPEHPEHWKREGKNVPVSLRLGYGLQTYPESARCLIFHSVA